MKIYISLFLIIATLAFSACNKEDTIVLDPIPEKVVPDNPTDVKINDILNTYQSKVIYKWDRRYVSSDASAYPPSFELVIPFIELLEEFWIAPYDEQKKGFMRDHLPIEIVLVGSYVEFQKGEAEGFNAAGFAVSVSRIILANVNNFDLKDKNWLDYQIIVFHHEFAHIMDNIYGRPVGFDDVSKGLYAGTSSYTEFSYDVARERGFWEPYGMSNESEDFATVVQAIVTTPKQELLNEINDYDLLKRKYLLAYRFYLKHGIDLHNIQESIATKLVEKGLQ